MLNTERFSNRAANYVLYRPHYPVAIMEFLRKAGLLSKETVVADIGSGTGISSELFLQNGNVVYRVEPNKEMREAAENSFGNNPHFKSINGTAEATMLPNESVDLIIAGQAFHWFEREVAKREFLRIAKPGANLVLMWNDRKTDSPFQEAYEQLLFNWAVDYEKVTHRNIEQKDISSFFAPAESSLASFPNVQHFDFGGLKGRLLSSSYAPLPGHANYQPMMEALKGIFGRYSQQGKLMFECDCRLFFGHLK